jgi:NhaP-type Na+/H+ or K+/H+ antiporter
MSTDKDEKMWVHRKRLVLLYFYTSKVIVISIFAQNITIKPRAQTINCATLDTIAKTKEQTAEGKKGDAVNYLQT